MAERHFSTHASECSGRIGSKLLSSLIFGSNSDILTILFSIYNGGDELENDLRDLVFLNLIENFDNQLERDTTKSKRAKIFLPTLF